VRIVEGIEQAIKMGKIEGYTMGARKMMRDESEDDPEAYVRLQTCCLDSVKSHTTTISRLYGPHKRCEYHGGVLGHSLEYLQIFKNRDWMMVSKKQVEFVKDDVINHMVTRTSLD
jgi:hypothetical protein